MALAVAGMTPPALACSPMPYPPPPASPAGASAADIAALQQAWSQSHAASRAVEDRAWQLKRQARLFDEAKSIAVVRYDRAGKVSGLPKEFDYMNGSPTAILKPVRWVKGKGSPAELTLGMGNPPPCGQIPAHDAYYGKPGEVFLVYLADDDHVMEGFRLEKIAEPRTLAALTQPQ
ncbi:MAG: hypothetical protein Q8R82_19025 [Hyphomonadaceae bacterium]|nr:hypothetical protein [Hyphomonadaceae bacterium]